MCQEELGTLPKDPQVENGECSALILDGSNTWECQQLMRNKWSALLQTNVIQINGVAYSSQDEWQDFWNANFQHTHPLKWT